MLNQTYINFEFIIVNPLKYLIGLARNFQCSLLYLLSVYPPKYSYNVMFDCSWQKICEI